jgi:CheY-like chemotaxis protein
MDVEMPEMDGFTAAQKMREVEASAGLKPTPIIAMTAHVLPEERQKCKDSGMDDYMSKPFDPADLQRRISALSDG